MLSHQVRTLDPYTNDVPFTTRSRRLAIREAKFRRQCRTHVVVISNWDRPNFRLRWV